MTSFQLLDKIEVLPGVCSWRSLLVFARCKKDADICARLHHAAILHQAGKL